MKTLFSICVKCICCFCVFFKFFVLPICASEMKPVTLDTCKLNKFFSAIEKQYMGSVAISEGGKVVYIRSNGYADVATEKRATQESVYMIGSISKTFTSLLTFMAVNEGKIKLTDNLQKFFPTYNIPNADSITIDDLLYHKSGLFDIFEAGDDYLSWYTKPQSRDELLKRIAKGGAEAEPRTRQKYCNAGYVLLTFILEDAFNMPYANLVEGRITRPLHLSSTRYADGINIEKGDCRSYIYRNGWQLEAETHPSVPQGAGALCSSPTELVRFGDALFHDVFSDSILARMKARNGSIGRGLFPFNYYGNIGYGHTGGIDGFQSVLAHFDEGDVTIAMCSNGNNLNQNDILITILDAVYGRDYEIPNFSFISVPKETLQRYVGIYENATLKMRLHITTDGKMLTGQAEGQASFDMEATAENSFVCSKAGIAITFENGNLTLHQAGQDFIFKKL